MNTGNDLNNTLNTSNENLMNTFNNLTSLLADSQIVNYSLNEITSGNEFQVVNQLGQTTNNLIDPPVVNSITNPLINEITSGNEFQVVNQQVQTANSLVDPPVVNSITNPLLNEITSGNEFQVVNQLGQTTNGLVETITTFNSTVNPLINENLHQVSETYDNEQNQLSENAMVFNQIKQYASQINCTSFQGKGTIDDYTQLFNAASQIANESSQMQLYVDVEGFTVFGNAADELSKLFSSFILKLQNVNIINDLMFLQNILVALEKIYNLSIVFGQFKQTLIATSTIKIPKTTHDTCVILDSVMNEVNSAMNYISHFVSPENDIIPMPNANLTYAEHNIINQSTATINNWNSLCEQGLIISMTNNSDVQHIQSKSNELKNTTKNLINLTQKLKLKMDLLKSV